MNSESTAYANRTDLENSIVPDVIANPAYASMSDGETVIVHGKEYIIGTNAFGDINVALGAITNNQSLEVFGDYKATSIALNGKKINIIGAENATIDSIYAGSTNGFIDLGDINVNVDSIDIEDSFVAGSYAGSGETVTAGNILVSIGKESFVKDGVYGGNYIDSDGHGSSGNITINFSGNSDATLIMGGGVAMENGTSNASNISINVMNSVIRESIVGGGNSLGTNSTTQVGNVDIYIVNSKIGEVGEENVYGGGIAVQEGATASAESILINVENSTLKNGVYGGGNAADGGTTNVKGVVINVKKNSEVKFVAGGGSATGSETKSNADNVLINADYSTIGDAVYGGGHAKEAGFASVKDVVVNVKNGSSAGFIYGGGKAESLITTTHSISEAGNVIVNVDGSIVTDAVYGGGVSGENGETSVKNTTINISRASEVMNVYGGGRIAPDADNTTRTTNADNVEINIDYSTVNGIVYGGGDALENGTANTKDVVINVKNSSRVSSIFGGGKAVSLNIAHEANALTGNVKIILDHSTVSDGIYGGAYALGRGVVTVGDVTIDVKNGSTVGSIVGGGIIDKPADGNMTGQIDDDDIDNVLATASNVSINVDKSSVKDVIFGGGIVNNSGVGSVKNVVMNIKNKSIVKDIYGGGSVSGNYNISSAENIEINVDDSVADVIIGGSNSENAGESKVEKISINLKNNGFANYIYGGGRAEGNNSKVTVSEVLINILGGKVKHDIYAGGITIGADATSKVTGNATINLEGATVGGNIWGTGKGEGATIDGIKTFTAKSGSSVVIGSISNFDVANISSGLTVKKIEKITDINVSGNSETVVDELVIGDLAKAQTLKVKDNARLGVISFNSTNGDIDNSIEIDKLAGMVIIGDYENSGAIIGGKTNMKVDGVFANTAETLLNGNATVSVSGSFGNSGVQKIIGKANLTLISNGKLENALDANFVIGDSTGGSLTAEQGSFVNNKGNLSIVQNGSFDLFGTFNNIGTFALNNIHGMVIKNGTINNSGIFNSNSKIDLMEKSVINVSNVFNNNLTLSVVDSAFVNVKANGKLININVIELGNTLGGSIIADANSIINNAGSLNIVQNGKLSLSGTLNNSSNLIIVDNASLNVKAKGILENTATGIITVGNAVSGALIAETGSILNNAGSLNVVKNGKFDLVGTLNNSGSLVIDNTDGMTISSGVLNNSGTFTNSSSVKATGNAKVNISNKLVNNSTLSVNDTAVLTLKAKGILENKSTASFFVGNAIGGTINAEFGSIINNAGSLYVANKGIVNLFGTLNNIANLVVTHDASLNVKAKSVLENSSTGVINIGSDTGGILASEFNSIINNAGTLNIVKNGNLYLGGTLNNNADISVGDSASLNVKAKAKLENTATGNIVVGNEFGGLLNVETTAILNNAGNLKVEQNGKLDLVGTINNNSVITVIDSASLNLLAKGKLVNAQNATIIIGNESGGSLTSEATSSITNAGSLSVVKNGKLTLAGTLTNSSILTVTDSASLTVKAKGALGNTDTGVINIGNEFGGTLSVEFGSTINNAGTIKVAGAGEFDLAGTFNNNGEFELNNANGMNIESGVINNNGKFVNNSKMNVAGTSKINVTKSFINNSELSLIDNAVLTIKSKGVLNNSNTGKITIGNEKGGVLNAEENSIINNEGSLDLVAKGKFDLNGILNNLSNIDVSDVASLNIKANGQLINATNATINIGNGAGGVLSSEAGSIISNAGNLNIVQKGQANVEGLLTNNGVIDVAADALLNIKATGKFLNEKSGVITVNGSLNVDATSAISNMGKMTIADNGKLTLLGTLNNNGNFYSVGTGSMSMENATIINKGNFAASIINISGTNSITNTNTMTIQGLNGSNSDDVLKLSGSITINSIDLSDGHDVIDVINGVITINGTLTKTDGSNTVKLKNSTLLLDDVAILKGIDSLVGKGVVFINETINEVGSITVNEWNELVKNYATKDITLVANNAISDSKNVIKANIKEAPIGTTTVSVASGSTARDNIAISVTNTNIVINNDTTKKLSVLGNADGANIELLNSNKGEILVSQIIANDVLNISNTAAGRINIGQINANTASNSNAITINSLGSKGTISIAGINAGNRDVVINVVKNATVNGDFDSSNKEQASNINAKNVIITNEGQVNVSVIADVISVENIAGKALFGSYEIGTAMDLENASKVTALFTGKALTLTGAGNYLNSIFNNEKVILDIDGTLDFKGVTIGKNTKFDIALNNKVITIKNKKLTDTNFELAANEMLYNSGNDYAIAEVLNGKTFTVEDSIFTSKEVYAISFDSVCVGGFKFTTTMNNVTFTVVDSTTGKKVYSTTVKAGQAFEIGNLNLYANRNYTILVDSKSTNATYAIEYVDTVIIQGRKNTEITFSPDGEFTGDGYVGFNGEDKKTNVGDVYKFSVDDNSVGGYGVALKNINSNVKVQLVQDLGDGKFKVIKTYSGRNVLNTNWNNLASGDYEIRVMSSDSGAGKYNTEYDLQVNKNNIRVGVDTTNDTFSTASKEFDSSSNYYVGFGDKADNYKLNLTDKGIGKLTFAGLNKFANVRVEILNSTGKVLYSVTAKKGLAIFENIVFGNQDYYVRVNAASTNGSKDTNYSLSFKASESANSKAKEADKVITLEDNTAESDFLTFKALDRSIGFSLDVADDNTDKLKIEIYSIDKNGKMVLKKSVSSAKDIDFRLSLNNGETYFAKVSSSATANVDEYKLTITNGMLA